ncbi:unnamed protein product [Rhizoctonia solani]|uniref:F-box-like domain protein n=1 Tax=Rhizoctonia solani TaxID=456999 RepID=A0A8H3E294_9AGAM|nr:unnamed protein product [Rhizoctonia solani]
MIEKLKSAGDQLRAAWENYYHVYSTIDDSYNQGKSPHGCGFSLEVSRQLDAELAFISSYEPKIQQIKAAISCARNHSSSLSPINTLPPEVLTRVFQLVAEQPCKLHLRAGDQLQAPFPRYPDYLAHVCSHWRRTAISCCSLWRHIDLSTYAPWYKGLNARAETHIARTNGLPIELHISDHVNQHSKKAKHEEDLVKLVSRISTRTETLKFVVTDPFRHFHESVLTKLLLSRSLILTELVVTSEIYHWDNFILADKPSNQPPVPGSQSFRLGLWEDQLERCFAPLTVLCLRGIFPLWSSAAYQGLVDLRLLSTTIWSHIQEVELVTILKSSPELRILHFGLKIENLSDNVSPVHLKDLRVIKIFPENGEKTRQCPSSLLRLLAPGPNPLRLSFSNCYEPNMTMLTELDNFFERSRVAWFYSRGVFPPINLLLRHAVTLERVVLDDLKTYCSDELPFTWLRMDGLHTLPRLKSLRIRGSTLSVDELHLLVECCPSGIVLQSCDVENDICSEWFSSTAFSSEEFNDTFLNVKIMDRNPSMDSTIDWDILD